MNPTLSAIVAALLALSLPFGPALAAITLVNAASVPPRENVIMRIEVKDVKAKANELSDIVRTAKGSVADFKTRLKENGQTRTAEKR